jgi:hypothetical protein
MSFSEFLKGRFADCHVVSKLLAPVSCGQAPGDDASASSDEHLTALVAVAPLSTDGRSCDIQSSARAGQLALVSMCHWSADTPDISPSDPGEDE